MTTIGLLALWTMPAQAKKDFDLTSVKTAAIVGFGGTIEIEQKDTRTGIGVVDTIKQAKNAAETINSLEDGSLKTEAQDDTVRAYSALESGLESGFGWTVLSRDELAADPAYAEVHAGLTGKSKLAKMGAEWGAGMCPSGIVHWTRMTRVKQDQRDAMIDALGVDGVLIASVAVTGKDKGVSVGGIGTSRVKPQAGVRLSLYQKGEKKPVWKGYAMGPKVEEAIKGDFGNASDPSAAILAAIDNAVVKVTGKYAPVPAG